MNVRHVIGGMSGTSMDAVDVALVRIEGNGLSMKASFIAGHSVPFASLAELMRPIAKNERVAVKEIIRVRDRLSSLYVQAVATLIAHRVEQVDMVGVHGQTVFHQPPVSMQLINPHLLHQAIGVPIAFDFRGADLAAGGHGAPITPLADYIYYRSDESRRAIVNLGGFANYTSLPAASADAIHDLSDVQGGDICSCNQLLDHIARCTLDRPYDADGMAAANGTIDPKACESLYATLIQQARHNRSLGTGDEAMHWFDAFEKQCSGEDLAATACDAIGRVVAEIVTDAEQILLAGGGCNNQSLANAISKHSDANVSECPDAQYREAICMAILTALAADDVSITLPNVTGRDEGAIILPCWIH